MGAQLVDYRASFASTRGDSHWKRKLALGVVIALIPYLGIVWMLGWQMQYQRNIAWGYEGRIPEWSDFKGQVLLGLKGLLAVLPYSFVLSADHNAPARGLDDVLQRQPSVQPKGRVGGVRGRASAVVAAADVADGLPHARYRIHHAPGIALPHYRFRVPAEGDVAAS